VLLHHRLSFAAEQLTSAQSLSDRTQLLPPAAQLDYLFY
jgi:hypothetical protein